MSPYYRYQPTGARFGSTITPAVKVLLIINVAVYVVQLLTKGSYYLIASGNGVVPIPVMTFYFGLNPSLVLGSGYAWQLVTYMFLHSPYSLWHIIFNMLMLWMFGSELEAIWGQRKFLQYYFFTGIGAGLCSLIFYHTWTLGASGAIFGLFLAYGMIYPDRILLLFGIFPIKAKNAVILFGFLALFFGLGGRDNVAHFAHLGGLLFGYIYMKDFGKVQSLLNLKFEFSWKPTGRRGGRVEEEDGEIEFSMLDVNRILDKISQEGMKSLTSREKRILEKARDRMGEL